MNKKEEVSFSHYYLGTSWAAYKEQIYDMGKIRKSMIIHWLGNAKLTSHQVVPISITFFSSQPFSKRKEKEV